MKYFFFLIVLLAQTTLAQITITGRVIGESEKAKISQTLDSGPAHIGHDELPNLPLDSMGQFVLSYPSSVPRYVTLSFDLTAAIMLLLFPGDSVHVVYDHRLIDRAALMKGGVKARPPKGWLTVTGNNAAGHWQLNQLDFVPFDKFVPIRDSFNIQAANRSVAKVAGWLRSYHQRYCEGFDSLKALGLVTDKYRDAVKRNFRYLFLAETGQQIYEYSLKHRKTGGSDFARALNDTLLGIAPDENDLFLPGLSWYSTY
jgi:hypothetical protein